METIILIGVYGIEAVAASTMVIGWGLLIGLGFQLSRFAVARWLPWMVV